MLKSLIFSLFLFSSILFAEEFYPGLEQPQQEQVKPDIIAELEKSLKELEKEIKTATQEELKIAIEIFKQTLITIQSVCNNEQIKPEDVEECKTFEKYMLKAIEIIEKQIKKGTKV